MQQKIIPGVVGGQDLVKMSKTDLVAEAARLMAKRHIGAVLVVEGEALIGIFTERDVTTRVVAKALDPKTVTLGEVMTAKPDTIEPDATVLQALELMKNRGYRHLPVVKDGAVLAIVSIRDLYGVVTRELEEGIRERDDFIHGTGYG